VDNGLPGPAPYSENLGAEMHRDAFVVKHLLQCGRHVGTFPAGELWSPSIIVTRLPKRR